MKILIHATGATMGGAMRHLTNFLPELGRLDTNNKYVVLVRESFPSIAVSENIQIERTPDVLASNWLKRVIADVVDLPKRIKKEKFDMVVSLTNFGPIWSSVPHIFFQRNPIYYCSYYLSKIKGREKLEIILRRRLAIESMKRADVIVTPSNAMTEMIQSACPQLKGCSFQTLYHGFEKRVAQEPLDNKYAKLFSVRGYKLLYPTHPAPHKGFQVLFEMLAHLKKERLQFTLFTTIAHDDWPDEVKKYEQQIHKLGLNDCVVFTGRVPQRQMGAIYESCDLMVYPSLCESFGFSMVEAMGYGLPIVAAGTAVNEEICGEGALYYPPTDFETGAEIIQKALDPEISLRITEAGKRRLSSYDWSWSRYTREFLKIVNEIC